MMKYIKPDVLKSFFLTVLVSTLAFFLSNHSLFAQEYKIVAIVNDDIITNYDIEKFLLPMIEQYKKIYSEDALDAKLKGLEENVLERLIEEKLILLEAKRINFEVGKKEVNEKFDKIVNKFPSREQFEISLERQGQTTKELKKQIREGIVIKKMVNYFVGSRVEISQTDIEEYYQDHLQDFILEEEYKVRHIFISKKGRDPILLKQDVDNVKARIQKGDDFAELAKSFSNGPNAPLGGDLGFVKRGQFQAQLDEIITTLNINDTAGPVESDRGFHFLKLEAKKDVSIQPIEEVEPYVRNLLFKEAVKEKRNSWIEEVKLRSFIEIK